MLTTAEIQQIIMLSTRVIERLLLTACGPLCLFIGYKLYKNGTKGELKGSASQGNAWKVQLERVSPGALVFLIGLVIIIIVFTQGFSSTEECTGGYGIHGTCIRAYHNINSIEPKTSHRDGQIILKIGQ